MVEIRCFRFQPFESRRGRDEVIGLKFPYNPALIDLLKLSLAQAKAKFGGKCLGGWQPEPHRAWFVEPHVWGFVRQRLVERGCQLIGDQPIQTVPNTDLQLQDLLVGATPQGRLDQVSAWVFSDWLEEHGDPRAAQVRRFAEARDAAMQLRRLFATEGASC